jgi:hypothetical protein
MFYNWPTSPFKSKHKIYSTLGEFRGSPKGDGVTKLHSGTDLPESGSDRLIFSPDRGLVRRAFPATGSRALSKNPSAGTGPIRIGHFGFNHISTIFPKPQSTVEGVRLPGTLPIYVVNKGDTVFLALKRKPKKDKDFKTGKVKFKKNPGPAIAFRKKANDSYEKVVFWPRNLAIGRGISSTSDLHCIYYQTDGGPYLQRRSIANALEVFVKYTNGVKPDARGLKLYSQRGDTFLLDIKKSGRSAVVLQSMGGVSLKVSAFSAFFGTCGIYELEYAIRAAGGDGGALQRTSMWRFRILPSEADSFILVDKTLSQFTNIDKKFTYYVFTKSRNRMINADNHWEIEDRIKWPDGRYDIDVWVKNISKARGAGNDPSVNEVQFRATVDLVTLGRKKREVTVVKGFRKK